MNICLYDPECPNKPVSRGLCSKHYTKARNNGTLESIAFPPKVAVQHFISNVNESTSMADCVVCGVGVSVAYRRKRDKYVWQCVLKERSKARGRGRFAYTYGEGMTIDKATAEIEYEKMYSKYNGLCAICKAPPPAFRRLALEHCHTTGKIRGILCTSCNLVLGHAKDSTQTLKAAIAYLDDNR